MHVHPLLEAHRRMAAGHSNGSGGVAALEFIFGLVEAQCPDPLGPKHPLVSMLHVASIDHYEMYMRFARCLRAASSMSGFELVAGRLCDPDEAAAAMAEIEVAGALIASAFQVRHPAEVAGGSPDLLVRAPDGEFALELTSLRTPESERRERAVMDEVFRSMFPRVGICGDFDQIPEHRDLPAFKAELAEVVKRAKAELVPIRFEWQGVFSLLVVAEGAHFPEGTETGIRIADLERRDTRERILGAMSSKMRQIRNSGLQGILLVVDYFGEGAAVREAFQADRWWLDNALKARPELMGLILATPRVRPIWPETPEPQFNGAKELVAWRSGRLVIGSLLFWPNPHAERPFPGALRDALVEFDARVDLLPAP